MTVAMLARYPIRRTSSGGVLVSNRTTMPYNRENKVIPAKAMPIVSRTSGVLVSSVPYDESSGNWCVALLLANVWESEKVWPAF